MLLYFETFRISFDICTLVVLLILVNGLSDTQTTDHDYMLFLDFADAHGALRNSFLLD